MADVGLRDLGAVVPGLRSVEPDPPAVPRAPAVVLPLALSPIPESAQVPDVLVTPPPKPVPAAEPAPRGGFGGDLPSGVDALGIDATLAHVAELVAHKRAASPLCIGLLGGPGAGKSFALARLAARVGALAGAAARLKDSPFLSRVHVQPVDAASLEGEPALGLAASLHKGLRQPYPDLARELGHAARDPHLVLREVNEKLDDARRRLDSERRALDDAGSRRARLTETVLYEAAGSQVDAYARANRAMIEQRLAGFGIHGDPLRDYKDLVQYVSGAGKLGLTLRALYAFKGQLKLIVIAVLLAAVGIGLGIAIESQAYWLADLRGGPKAGAGLANWLEAHMSLLSLARTGAFALAGLAIVANLARAVAFVTPIFKGVRLLDGDLDTRRRDLDSLYAHQTKRVDMLDADVERLTAESAEAERRVGYTGPATLNEPSPFAAAGATGQSFFSTLARLMAEPGRQAPQRVVLALDHLDAVPPARARQILDALHRAAGPGLVTLVAVDAARLGAEAQADLERWIQVPVQVAAGGGECRYGALVDAALGRASARAPEAAPDATRAELDRPIGDDEAATLAAMAALAGPSPRGIKRFVNLYTLARLGSDGHPGALALMLALAQGGTSEERAAVAGAFAGRDPAAAFDVPGASPRLRAALAAASAAGGPFNLAAAAQAARRASTFAMTPVGVATTG
ncbi:hypothetical protein RHAL1_00676 [Beijerinckiaceae bacterium RH AL1]|nr:hypothetical protein RHAL8_00644 [Beijerinckiaceae bacterium RH AL8]VVB43357.1 hypothetical protein RHCH11_RHCH11_00646 [Beijerinckiaceae bacterium RH CH11]VVC53793.1 hypothetical protein RHAL1_00676 [Beijerinckiaceae bacterium RH AL1]